MLLPLLILVSAIVSIVVIPLFSLYRYYHPHNYSVLENIFWVGVTILTWPFVPVALAMRKRDYTLSLLFWISFGVCIVASALWLTENFALFIEIHRNYINNLGTII